MFVNWNPHRGSSITSPRGFVGLAAAGAAASEGGPSFIGVNLPAH